MRTLFLFIAAFACNLSYAQDYEPMLAEGRVWKTVMPSMAPDKIDDFYYTETVCGDTIVNDRVCKKIHIVCDNPENNPFTTDYTIAAFEEDRKLYVCNDDGGASKIMDFNLHKGDFISNCNAEVIEEDYIEVNGKRYRRLTFNYGFDDENACWVEGIGSNQDFWFYGGQRPLGSHYYYYMSECYDNGIPVFNKEDFKKEPVANGITSVNKENEQCNILYNLSGQRISTANKGKIYIQNGKKQMKH